MARWATRNSSNGWKPTAAKALAGDSDAMVQAVAHSCRMKADIVARDERETGERALLNLGHTFGHALEAATGFSDRLIHGEGVAIGMALAFRLSVQAGPVPRPGRRALRPPPEGRRPAIRHFRHSRPPPGADELIARHGP